MNDTICAIATAPGVGAIALIRVSGPAAIPLCDQLFLTKSGQKRLAEQPSHTVHLGQFQRDGYLIDEVVATLFRAPHSYTGEDSVEISCHGSTYIQQKIIRILIEAGCRLAEPGEFTRRAFSNGKMDLSQAEAVAELIASTSAANHKLALQQMRGGVSREIDKLRAQLLHFVTMIELELDFSEEQVEFANRQELNILAAKLEKNLRQLTESFKLGNALKQGIPVAIVGETNAGKSTLLNQLLNEDKAIVSPIPGTTRDVIEDLVNIRGIGFRFIDTAGLRQTKDEIELLGIERTYQQIEQASVVLWVIDSTKYTEHIEWMASRILPRSEGKTLVVLLNKVDKLNKEEQLVLDEQLRAYSPHRLLISAKKGQNIDALKARLLEFAGLPDLARQDIIITNLRHFEVLKAAHEAICRVQEGMSEELSGEFLSQDLRACIHHLGQITGVITTDEVLGTIFERFCIGK
ncbi:MAG: tRNA modification GTPase MnmE [Bacteroidetes bacterium ADurb.Bin416]|nr:MAG: tRNA modification GTPase MnmE [Bacteroidetes bacterium ADurb.Bin416]